MGKIFTNKNNRGFYEDMLAGTFDKYAKMSGIESALELDVINNYFPILNSASILEIGAGEGRVINGLLKRRYRGVIYGVERN